MTANRFDTEEFADIREEIETTDQDRVMYGRCARTTLKQLMSMLRWIFCSWWNFFAKRWQPAKPVRHVVRARSICRRCGAKEDVAVDQVCAIYDRGKGSYLHMCHDCSRGRGKRSR